MIEAILAAAVVSSCGAPDGHVQLWSASEQRILLIGEVHGTREIPRLVGELLCAAAEGGARTVTLALEASPENGQAEIDAFLASDGGPSARLALMRAPMWRDPASRGSEAVLDLVETARRLKSSIVLVDPVAATQGPTDGMREQAMAAALATAAAKGRLIALLGIGHADREGFTSLKVASAAQRLPADAFISLAPLSAGGQHWSCIAQVCAPRDLPDRGAGAAREIRFSRSIRSGFDGAYLVGGPFTASPPAKSASDAKP